MATRALRCPTCGAPLKWKGDAAVVECRYCQTHIIAKTGIITGAPANAVSQPKSSALALLVIGCAAMVLVIGGAVAVFAGAKNRQVVSPLEPAVASEVLAGMKLQQTAEQLKNSLSAGKSSHQNSLSFPVADESYSQAIFTWDPQHPEHIRSVLLRAAENKKLPPQVRDKVAAEFGEQLRVSSGGHHYSGEGVNLSINETSIQINAYRQGPGWKERLQVLWGVMKYAALDVGGPLAQKTKRDVLNLGYPLEQLKGISIDVLVDSSGSEVKRVIPGVVSKGERHQVGLGHPWMERADLFWKNERGGKLGRINLFYPKTFDLKERRQEVERCLAPLFGSPKVTETDHLAGLVTLRFKGKQGVPSLAAYGQNFMVDMQPWDAPKVTQKGFEKLIETLAACGGKP